MRPRLALAVLVALALGIVAALIAPALRSAAAPPPPTVTATIGSVQCLAGGGLKVSASGSTTGGTLKYASLGVSEIGTVPSNYIPYEPKWSISWWNNYDSYNKKTAPPSDSRTLDTTDSFTWNHHSWANVWTGSNPAAWWTVYYSLTVESRGNWYGDSDQVYVNCATGQTVNPDTLQSLEWLSEEGNR